MDFGRTRGQLDPSGFLTTVHNVSREPVRAAIAPKVPATARRIAGELPCAEGAVALRFGKAFLSTPDGPLSAMSRGDVCEVADYDPVRKVLLVIGQSAPTRFSPLVWTVLRTNPAVTAVAVLHPPPDAIGPKGSEPMETRFLPSSFEEAMQAAKSMKDQGHDHLLISGRAVVVTAPELDKLPGAVKALMLERKEVGR